MTWFEEEGWFYDKRDHMWKRVRDEKTVLGEQLTHSADGHCISPSTLVTEMSIMEKKSHDSSVSKTLTKIQKIKTEPIFKKVSNILIFDNCQYPLKFHEVMFEK